jgi:hypothetical protein
MTDLALDPAQGVKPLDFGGAGVNGSVDAYGRLVALNTFHARHGYVTLTTADPFPRDRWRDQAAVRAYRAGLAALQGFGPAVGITASQAFLLDGVIPHVQLTLADGARAEVTTLAHAGGAFQRWQIDGVIPRWRGRLSVQRCAYTQLTEGGPIPMPPVESHATFEAGTLTLENPALEQAVAISGFAAAEPWAIRADGPVEIDLPGAEGTTILVFGFGTDAEAARAAARDLADQDVQQILDEQRRQWRARLAAVPDDPCVRRGLVYGLAMAVPVDDTNCILTDHMLLPLSWNRDAYYVALALQRWRPELAEIVRRHLLWMFETAERVDGLWGRAYLANGRVKDRAYQLDQQLFPLLELADYVLATGDRALLHQLEERSVLPLIGILLARRAPEGWLFATDETPADDPLTLPYHLSSHILMWRTFRRLAEAGMNAGLTSLAEDIRGAINTHFVAEHDGRRLYAYATDGQGTLRFYHDANDIPLVWAPAWGFVPADDPVWRATVDFAFSAANEGGYYASGLGSVHTPAPWPLGDVQNLIVARALADEDRARRAWDRLHAAARWDGALPEAYHAETHAVVSRHWFAWPNAALACVALGAFD